MDFQNLPKFNIGTSDKNKIYSLEHFLTLFCICMSKDDDYLQRIHIFEKYPDFFYKVIIIAISITNVCCCGRGLDLNENLTCSCFKTGQIIFETFKTIEERNLSLNIKKTKMKCVDYLVKNLGKNIGSVYLLKMENICDNDNDIFNYIINETNLLKETLKRNDDSFGHSIDNLEKFLSFCTSPELIFDILLLISNPNNRLERRLFRELLLKLPEIIKEKDFEKLEKSLYGDIFEKFLQTLKLDIYQGEYEGIWQALLNSENQSIIKIFNKKKYNATQIFMVKVNNLIENHLIGMNLTAVIRIMTLFLKIGEKVKNQFGGDNNYYANEFKDIYLKISEVTEIKNDEDYQEFENYFK